MLRIFFRNINPLLFNLILFVFLFIGIQNSNNKKNVFFLKYESVEVPVSFIAGSSFIFGSLYSNILISLFSDKNK
mgnify:CR=1 FL=1